jgi:hypothetical protein
MRARVADDDAIAALIVELAELRREVEELRGVRDQLSDVAATVAAVREQLERLVSDADVVRPRVVWWPDLDEQRAEELREALNVWVAERLVARSPLAEQTLYPCWPEHPEVVDALTALHATWRAAYQNPSATPVDAATWLDRWLPSLLGQVKTGLRSCERRSHTAAVSDEAAQRQDSA